MRIRLRWPNRRLSIGGIVLLASVLLLGVGLFTIILALNDDVDLPSEGSLQEIIAQNEAGYANLSATATAVPSGAPAPATLVIPRLQVEAPVLALGLDEQNYPAVPNDPDHVAWYTFTAAPGQTGNAVFSGHVDWVRRGRPIPGVFYRLRELELGDQIIVRREDGVEIQYRVIGNVAVEYNDPNVVKVMDRSAKDVITLITCGGTWLRDYRSPQGGSYSHRIIVRGERVQQAASSSPGG